MVKGERYEMLFVICSTQKLNLYLVRTLNFEPWTADLWSIPSSPSHRVAISPRQSLLPAVSWKIGLVLAGTFRYVAHNCKIMRCRQVCPPLRTEDKVHRAYLRFWIGDCRVTQQGTKKICNLQAISWISSLYAPCDHCGFWLILANSTLTVRQETHER